jgi:phospholipid transport system substrate-binding protein
MINRQLLLSLTLMSIAAFNCGWDRARAAPASTAQAPILRLIDTLLTIMKQGRTVPFEQRFESLAPVIDQAFDLEAILHASVGPSWAGLATAQQDQLREAFRRYTVTSYVHSFDSLNGIRLEVLPGTRATSNGEQIVGTSVVAASGDTHALDYVMRLGDSGWHAVDVLAEGTVSRVAVQRSDFRRLLAQGGAAALVDSLRAKARDLAGS